MLYFSLTWQYQRSKAICYPFVSVFSVEYTQNLTERSRTVHLKRILFARALDRSSEMIFSPGTKGILFNDISIFSTGGHFVQPSWTVRAILLEGYTSNISVKLFKRGTCINGLFCPPPPYGAKIKKKSLIYSYQFIRTITKMYMSQITLTFTVDMVTKMAAKIGWKQEIGSFGAKLRGLTEKLT